MNSIRGLTVDVDGANLCYELMERLCVDESRQDLNWKKIVCILASEGDVAGIVAFANMMQTKMPWGDIAHSAAEAGHLAILQLDFEPLQHLLATTTRSWRGALLRGRLAILDWGYANRDKFKCLDNFLAITALPAVVKDIYMSRINKRAVVSWLVDHGTSMTVYDCALAAEQGDVETVKLLRSLGAPWDHLVCEHAALGGHFKMLRYAVEAGAVCSSLTTAIAAKLNQVCMLQFLHTNGVPIHGHAMRWAVLYKNREAAAWLARHETPDTPNIAG